MSKDIENYVLGYADCQRKFKAEQKVVADLQHIEKRGIWKDVAIDYIGPLNSDRGNKHALVLIDMFTKYVEAEIVEHANAESTIRVLKKIFLRRGIPETILTDDGTHFTAEAVAKLFEEFGIKGKHWIKPLVCNSNMDKSSFTYSHK